MSHTQQTVQSHTKQLIQGTHSASTEYDVFSGGGASTIITIQSLIIVNNDANSSHTVTLTKQEYDGGYSAVLTQTYTVASNASEVPFEFYGVSLEGSATNPDKIVVEFGTALVDAGDTIDIQATSVKFE